MVAIVVGSEYHSLSGHNFFFTGTELCCKRTVNGPLDQTHTHIDTVCMFTSQLETVYVSTLVPSTLCCFLKKNKNIPSVQQCICCFYSKLCPILSLSLCFILKWVQYDVC